MSGLIWASPLALWGLVALVVPVLIHLRRTPALRRVAFPSLRFIPVGRLASVRRRVLQDWPLLLVRMAAVAAAVAAMAGPIVVTPARLAGWEGQVARAVVVDARGASPASLDAAVGDATGDATVATRIDASIEDGVIAAAAWFAHAPPARREVVLVGAFARDGVTAGMLDALPEGAGVRVVRVPADGEAPAALRRLAWIDGRAWIEHRDVTLTAETSSLSAPRSREAADLPLEIDADEGARTLFGAAIEAVLTAGVFLEGDLVPVHVVWNREAPVVETPANVDVRAAIERMSRVGPPADATASGDEVAEPWVAIVPGRLFAAQGPAGLVVRGVGALDAAAALGAARAVVAAMTPSPDLRRLERAMLTDAARAALERPAAPVDPATVARAGATDARWAWALVLVLMGLEQLMRRPKAAAGDLAAPEREVRVA